MGRRKWENVNRWCRRPDNASRSWKRGENDRNGGNGSPDLVERNFRSCSIGGNFSFGGKGPFEFTISKSAIQNSDFKMYDLKKKMIFKNLVKRLAKSQYSL